MLHVEPRILTISHLQSQIPERGHDGAKVSAFTEAHRKLADFDPAMWICQGIDYV